LATINRDGAAWFGNKPVTVISANVDHSVARWRRIVPFNVEAYNRIWADMQRSLTQISTRSEFIVAAESGHSVMVEHPETVIQAIRDMVNTLR
jgi:pimeloyl-ACP methyl ester carboxylesterase